MLQHFRGQPRQLGSRPDRCVRRRARGDPRRLPRRRLVDRRARRRTIAPTATADDRVHCRPRPRPRSICSASRSAGSSRRRSRSCGRRSSDDLCWRRPGPRARRGCTAGARTSPMPPAARASRRTSSTSCSPTPRRARRRGWSSSGGSCSARRGATPRRATPHATRSTTRSSSGASPTTAHSQRLTGIECPTLVIQGDGDLMIPTKLSHLMAGLIPDARIRIYPDAAHGFLFQYPAEVAADVNAFLA